MGVTSYVWIGLRTRGSGVASDAARRESFAATGCSRIPLTCPPEIDPKQDPKHDFGPYGLSFASDRWELRDTIAVRMIPRNSDHPYHHKDLFIDKQTLNVMYSFAYDQKQELWKIIWHNKRWSEDERLTGPRYPGWKGVPKPMDNIIVNVQTGTGSRIEFWDRTGTAFESKAKVRSFIDVGRLTKGRCPPQLPPRLVFRQSSIEFHQRGFDWPGLLIGVDPGDCLGVRGLGRAGCAEFRCSTGFSAAGIHALLREIAQRSAESGVENPTESGTGCEKFRRGRIRVVGW